MRKILLLMMVFGWTITSHTQNFQLKSVDPFDIQTIDLTDTSKAGLVYKFFDDDQDGDLDLIIMGLDNFDTTSASIQYNMRYFVSYQENIGSKISPQFGPREDRYTSFHYPEPGDFMLPAIGDLNADGRVDFVISSKVDIYDGQTLQFQIQNPDGTFTETTSLDWDLPEFTPYSFFVPELVDLDMDGDLDLLLGGYYGGIDSEGETTSDNRYIYAKNVGTPQQPEFLGWFHNPYNLIPDAQSFFASGDIDLDGDMDLLNLKLLDDVPTFKYAENVASPGNKPQFLESQMDIGLPLAMEDENFLFPTMVDLDSDGDMDLFLPVMGDNGMALRYYENNLCVQSISQSSASICYGETYIIGDEEFSETGVYTISEVGNDGCIKSIELDLTVYDEIDNQLTVNGIELSAIQNPNYTYQWIDCNTSEMLSGQTGHTFTAPYSGSFGVIIYDNNGCESLSVCESVTLSNATDVDYQQAVIVYPSPTRGMVYINNKSELEITNVNVFNAKGELLLKNDKGINNQIDLSSLNSGFYYINFKLGNIKVTKKIILMN